MNTALETAKSGIATLTNAPLVLSVAIGLLAFGWMLKLIPGFPPAWLPSTVILVGGLAGYFIVPMQGPADWHFQVQNPGAADMIRRVGVGLSLGIGVCLAHKYGIKRLEKKLKEKFGNGDTQFIQKPPGE